MYDVSHLVYVYAFPPSLRHTYMQPKMVFILGGAPISPNNEVCFCVKLALRTCCHELTVKFVQGYVLVRTVIHTHTHKLCKKSSLCTCMCDHKDQPYNCFYTNYHAQRNPFFVVSCPPGACFASVMCPLYWDAIIIFHS